MRSELKFYDYENHHLSDCGDVLDIEFSGAALNCAEVVLEKGSSPHFYPSNVYTPYFYFALALEKDLSWQVSTDVGVTALKTTPGNIWINPPKTPFTHNISEPCFFLILAIDEQTFLQHCPLDLKGKQLQFLNNYNVEDETIKGIMELFVLEAKNKGRNGRVFLHNLIALLANHYITHYSNFKDLQEERVNQSKLTQHHIKKIDRYIENHVSETIHVDDLANLLKCSKFYFLREFKKLMNVTPYQYLLNYRMSLAKKLLINNNPNIAEISGLLGFNDQSHFTRVFKSHFGNTPGQFIKEVNK
ncbi:helix-turn-helix transcriptional regulator [Pseudoalteromonas phenolica]|uniref:helix-turn-helix transcriptional regulator n=1 Tax=Pseudoalteromonas phenolica TaxID=161398 RepID=UPI00110AEBF2|nr:AraC family transcriptional regulator [Pseudoalteromonas phenolica]TMO58225.1 AraC family transcriptional regulator [Pseudoalteromonas phenolica]